MEFNEEILNLVPQLRKKEYTGIRVLLWRSISPTIMGDKKMYRRFIKGLEKDEVEALLANNPKHYWASLEGLDNYSVYQIVVSSDVPNNTIHSINWTGIKRERKIC